MVIYIIILQYLTNARTKVLFNHYVREWTDQPSLDAGGLSREYVLRIPSVS